MESATLKSVLSSHDLAINPESVVRISEGSWRAQSPSGPMVLRFIPQDARYAHRAIRTLEQVPPSPFLMLQPLRDFVHCEEGAIAVLEWIPGSTLREANQDELPLFFDRLARWHKGNAGTLPLYSRYTDREYSSIAEFVDGELECHLAILGLCDQEKSCRDILEPLTSGIATYTHGDVHSGNIVRRPDGGFALLDPEYLHAGCNYLDLDYIDWWGIEPDPAPWWVIKDQARESVAAYFAALGVDARGIPAIMKAIRLLSALRSHTNSVQFRTGDSDQAQARVRLVLDGRLPVA
jgi:hypothetical protein